MCVCVCFAFHLSFWVTILFDTQLARKNFEGENISIDCNTRELKVTFFMLSSSLFQFKLSSVTSAQIPGDNFIANVSPFSCYFNKRANLSGQIVARYVTCFLSRFYSLSLFLRAWIVKTEKWFLLRSKSFFPPRK